MILSILLGQHQELRYRLVTLGYEYYISSRIVTAALRGPAAPENLGWTGARRLPVNELHDFPVLSRLA